MSSFVVENVTSAQVKQVYDAKVRHVAEVNENDVVEVIKPEVSYNGSVVRLTFAEDISDKQTLNSVLRSKRGYVEYTDLNFEKIPHDMVHACLSGIPENTVIMGQTPDIVWTDEIGRLSVIEVATRNTYSSETAGKAIDEKLIIYKDLISTQTVQRMNVVVVYNTGVVSLSEISKECAIKLVQAYRLGRAILKHLSNEYHLSSNPTAEDVIKIYDWVSRKTFPELTADDEMTSKHLITPEVAKMIKELPTSMKVKSTRRGVRCKPKRSLKNWQRELPGRKRAKDILVHLPLVKSSLTDSEEYPSLDGYRDLLYLAGYGGKEEFNLEDWREKSIKERKSIRDDKSKKVMVSLSRTCREAIGSRGVLKKSMPADFRKEVELPQHESFGYGTQTTDIEEFLKQDLIYEKNQYLDISCLKDQHIKDSTKFDPHKKVEELLNTDLFTSISLLDLIVRECILAMKSNPDDNHASHEYEFIVRIIGDYNLIIRVTNYSTIRDSLVFFMLTSLNAFEPISDLFESVYYTGGVYHTKFTSLRKSKAENLVNITTQCLSHWCFLKDEIGGGLITEGFESVTFSSKLMTLLLLEDKEYTSRNMMHLRYYYFEYLCSGSAYANKIINKIDPICRSRLFYYIIDRVIKFESINRPAVEAPADLPKPSERDEDEDDEPELLESTRAKEPNFSITCFLGIEHNSLQTLLIPMYCNVFHNKNEQERTLSSKQILNKILTEEYKLFNCRFSTGDYSEEINLDEYQNHDFSVRAIKHGAQLLKKKVEMSLDESLGVYATRNLMSTNVEDLATTSVSAINVVEHVIRGDEELKKLGIRKKCFERALEDHWNDRQLVKNLDFIIEGITRDNKGRLKVQIFKKNQLGGVREILILDFKSRGIIRMLEDISHAVNTLDEVEMLTKPKTKKNFLGNHFQKVKARGKGRFVTWRGSLDKSTWCQLFVNLVFFTLMSTLLPEFTEFFRFVFNAHTKKIIELPKELVSSFLNAKYSHLEDYEVSKLRNEFLGHDEPKVTDGPYLPYIKNVSNMMQGILHETSSLLHCAYSAFLQEKIEEMLKRDYDSKSVISMQVSSDDSGILVTAYVPDNMSDIQFSREIDKKIQSLICICDRLFCMKTSSEKSTVTMLPFYEFNSNFFSGNNYATPMLKFIARATDDNPSESLKDRVVNLHNSLRQVRENGCSGALCSTVSVCQKIALNMNLGLGSMSFYEKYSKPIRDCKLSVLGCYVSLPPMLAGLYSSDFCDFYMCQADDRAKKVMSILHKKPAMGYRIVHEFSTNYRVWPTHKYEACLERLGINKNHSQTLEFEDLEIIFRKPISIDESKEMIKIQIASNSVARSFTFLSRCEPVMSSAYLLWDKIFFIKGRKNALDEVMDEIDLEEETNLDMSRIFPNYVDLSSAKALIEIQCHTRDTKTRYMFRPHVYEKILSGLEDMSLIKATLGQIWYKLNTSRFPDTTIRSCWRELQALFPWLTTSARVSFTRGGFDFPLQMINYIILLSDSTKPVLLTSIGAIRRGNNPIYSLAMLNCFRGRIVSLESANEKERNYIERSDTECLCALQSRMRDWQDLLLSFSGDYEVMDYYSNIMTEDIKFLVHQLKMELKNVCLSKRHESTPAAEFLSLIEEDIFYDKIVRNQTTTFDTYSRRPEKDKDANKEPYVLIRKVREIVVRYTISQRQVISIDYNTSVDKIKPDLSTIVFGTGAYIPTKLVPRYSMHMLWPKPQALGMFRGQIWLTGPKGEMVKRMTEGFKIASVLPYTHLSSHLLPCLWLSKSAKVESIERALKAEEQKKGRDMPLVLAKDGFIHILSTSWERLNSHRIRSHLVSRVNKEEIEDDEVYELMSPDELIEKTYQSFQIDDESPSEFDDVPANCYEHSMVAESSMESNFVSEQDISSLISHPLISKLLIKMSEHDYTDSPLGHIVKQAMINVKAYVQPVSYSDDMSGLISEL